MSIFRGKRDLRVKLSPMWTMINFLLSSLQISFVGYLLADHLKHHPIHTHDSKVKVVVSWMHYHVKDFYHAVIGLHVVSGLLTAILLGWDSLMCCCCPCWLGEGEWRVYDPDNPEARLVWRGGRVVGEEDKHDEEMTDGEQMPARDFVQDIYEDAYNEDKYTNAEVLEMMAGVSN